MNLLLWFESHLGPRPLLGVSGNTAFVFDRFQGHLHAPLFQLYAYSHGMPVAPPVNVHVMWRVRACVRASVHARPRACACVCACRHTSRLLMLMRLCILGPRFAYYYVNAFICLRNFNRRGSPGRLIGRVCMYAFNTIFNTHKQKTRTVLARAG